MKNKRFIALLLVPCLWACGSDATPAGVRPVSIPALPVEISVKAEALPPITDNTLAGQIEAGIQSDTAYNDVSFRYNNLIDFYNCIRDSVNNKKDPTETCLK